MGKHEQFVKNLIQHSETKNYEGAKEEWDLENIRYNATGNHCICGQFIKTECHIHNRVNNERLIIGSKCVNQVNDKYDLDLAFQALTDHRINAALIDFCHDFGIINDWEEKFMLDIWRKRKFTENQRSKKEEIEETIFDELIATAIKDLEDERRSYSPRNKNGAQGNSTK